jgi:hypothetical protein
MIPLYMQRVELSIERHYPRSEIVATLKPGICSSCTCVLKKKGFQHQEDEVEYEWCDCEYAFDETPYYNTCMRKGCGVYHDSSFMTGESLCLQCRSSKCLWCGFLECDKSKGAILDFACFKKGFYCKDCNREEVKQRIVKWIKASKRVTLHSTYEEFEAITIKLRQSDANWLKQRL